VRDHRCVPAAADQRERGRLGRRADAGGALADRRRARRRGGAQPDAHRGEQPEGTALLNHLAAALSAQPSLEPHALLVLLDGETVLEQYWTPYVAGDRPLVYSASKTFSATAVGLAIGEGRLALGDRLVDLLGVTTSDERVAEITVHHLLSMSTGHTEDTALAMLDVPAQRWVEGFLSLRPQAPVGSRHVYNNGASFMLGELIRRRTGEDLIDYLRPRLFEPLGIDATWDRSPIGECLGWSGLHVDVRGLASLGELLRCDGVWRGRRLLPEGWVARATSLQIPTDLTEETPEWRHGYGYQVWLGREGFRLDGAYGQFSFVLPERRMVVAVQSAQSGTQSLIDLLWDHLGPLPAVGSTETAPDRAPRGGPTGIAVPSDSGLGLAWASSGPVPLDPTMVPDGEEVGPPADLSDLAATRSGPELRLRLVAEGHVVELATAPGEWRRQVLRLGDAVVPVALAAGAEASGALQAQLVFTDTPHTLRLRLDDGGAAQAWKVNPLQGPSLANMRAH
jgi:CubicO group peptidase (beta-lactamase class C family)